MDICTLYLLFPIFPGSSRFIFCVIIPLLSTYNELFTHDKFTGSPNSIVLKCALFPYISCILFVDEPIDTLFVVVPEGNIFPDTFTFITGAELVPTFLKNAVSKNFVVEPIFTTSPIFLTFGSISLLTLIPPIKPFSNSLNAEPILIFEPDVGIILFFVTPSARLVTTFFNVSVPDPAT